MRPFIVVAAVVVAILAWTGFWFFSADRIEQGVEAVRSEGAPFGATLSYREVRVEGYPFRLVVRFTAPQLDWPAQPGRPRWRAQQLSLVMHPWNLRHVIADLSGQHDLTIDREGRRRILAIDVAQGLASMNGTPKRPERLSVDLNRLDAQLDGRELAAAERLQMHLRPGTGADDLVDFAASVTAAVLHQAPPAAPGAEIAAAEVQGSLKGSLSAGDLRAVLTGWRDNGGELALQRLRLDWGELRLEADGALSLDDAGYPAGTLSARVRGHEQLLEMAVASGQLPPDLFPTARTALGLLALASGGVLATTLSLEDGKVLLGPAQIARVRPLL